MEARINGLCLVISGPSGSGKTTAAERVLKDVPGTSRLVTTTTRAPRPHERDGVDYHFVGEEAFKNSIESGEFIEWALVYGKFYGAKKSDLAKQRSENAIVLAVVDVQGAKKYRQVVPDAVIVLMAAPVAQLERRLLADRPTMTIEERQRRLGEAEEEMAYGALCDRVIQNVDDGFEAAVTELKTLITL